MNLVTAAATKRLSQVSTTKKYKQKRLSVSKFSTPGSESSRSAVDVEKSPVPVLGTSHAGVNISGRHISTPLAEYNSNKCKKLDSLKRCVRTTLVKSHN